MAPLAAPAALVAFSIATSARGAASTRPPTDGVTQHDASSDKIEQAESVTGLLKDPSIEWRGCARSIPQATLPNCDTSTSAGGGDPTQAIEKKPGANDAITQTQTQTQTQIKNESEENAVPKTESDTASHTGLTAIDLCSGCGGIPVALRELGFKILALVESDPRCVQTLKANNFEGIMHTEIEKVDFTLFKNVSVLTGGPPCQPFSNAGLHHGESDDRNLWAHVVRAVREARPQTFMFEMVDGFLTAKFTKLRERTIDLLSQEGYLVQLHRSNASDHGLAQNRRRCILTGHRSAGTIAPPIVLAKTTVSEALQGLPPLGSLPEHTEKGSPKCYQGHMPSNLHTQAHTIVAGCHGPGGGNNTVIDENGKLRYFTISELARLQGFPMEHKFDPVWSHAIKQLGNACPPPMAKRWLERLMEKCYPRPEDPSTNLLPTDAPESSADELDGTNNTGPILEINEASEASEGNPDEHNQVAEPAISKEHQLLRKEISRRMELLRILNAQASVLYIEYCKGARQVYSKGGKLGMTHFALELKKAAERIEQQLSPERREAMVASIHAALPVLSPTPRKDKALSEATEVATRLAIDKSLEYAKLTDELRREKAICHALCLDDLSRSHDPREEQPPDEQKESYFNMINSELPSEIFCPKDAEGKTKVYFRANRSLLSEAEADDEVDFFHKDTIMAMEAELEAEGKYESIKANIPFRNPETGEDTTINSVVDSGATWCALKLSVVEKKLPHLLDLIQPSSMKFRDASNNRMSLIGRVPITVMVGSRALNSYSYVFRELGADFLFGANTLKRHGCLIDCHRNRVYVHDDPELGMPMLPLLCDSCEADACTAVNDPSEPTTAWTSAGKPTKCCDSHGRAMRLVCNKDSCRLEIDGNSEYLECMRETVAPGVKLVIQQDTWVQPGEPMDLDPKLVGLPPGVLHPLSFETCSSFIKESGLEAAEQTLQNPTNSRCPFRVSNPRRDRKPVLLRKGTIVARSFALRPDDQDTVLLAAVLEDPQGPSEDKPRDLEHGGIEDLEKLGFSLEKAIDPDQRLEDGSYAPLAYEKKLLLYEIARRWHYVFSRDTKIPKVSFLVVMEIPTGDAPPQQQAPYPIPERLRKAAMEEINKLLKAGLIEPSMSDWASPALVTVKKDSTATELKIKFAIDYRRVNAVTRLDAGGLGTQSDILFGVGGRYKYLGLCDAAGGFYQYLLAPPDRKKSAFILPAAMGGTLFQWRVAPYGLTRCPAGYSRGMQWVLKGLHDRDDLKGEGKGGATSWLDDICMRATNFAGFCDLFETVLSRLASAGMSLKGAKCELLHAELEILGFVATPHGLKLQDSKVSKIMEKGKPSNPKEAETFLGAVAFLRRIVPRISLLTAPMTDAAKRCRARFKSRAQPTRRARGEALAFNEDERSDSDQSWDAVMDHLDSEAVLTAPDFDDPLADFVLCTDASDFAVGGVLMQWQHPQSRDAGKHGPGPPPGEDSSANPGMPKGKYQDPLDNAWRRKAGWKLVIIGYYSKTLDEAQRNYPAFDKEAGAILLCVRHWSDLITYHRTSVYTDSAVATSMLTKHAAPPRLQRWGIELGTYLPHLQISYRRGVDNGLADLLSRFPAFKRFTNVRPDLVTLPDDLFEYVGQAPLYTRAPSLDRSHTAQGKVNKDGSSDRSYLTRASYELFDAKTKTREPETYWCAHSAPEIPGRGMKDRFTGSPDAVGSAENDTGETLDLMAVQVVAESERSGLIADMLQLVGEGIHQKFDAALSDHAQWLDCIQIFQATTGRPPCALLTGDASLCDQVAELTEHLNIEFTTDQSLECDFTCHLGCPDDLERADPSSHYLYLDPNDRSAHAYASLTGHEFGVQSSAPIALPSTEPLIGQKAPPVRLISALGQMVNEILHDSFGMPRLSADMDTVLREAAKDWTITGYGMPNQIASCIRTPSGEVAMEFPAQPLNPLIAGLEDDDDVGATPGTEQTTKTRARAWNWEDASDDDDVDSDEVPRIDPTISPVEVITLEHQLKDPALKQLIDALRGSRHISTRVRKRVADNYILEDDGLYRHCITDGEPGKVQVVPRSHRAAILARYHFSLADGGGHAGGELMHGMIKASYYWPDMERECHAFAGACERCGETRSQATIPVPSGVAPTPGRPWEVIHVDHKGPLSLSNGYTHVLVAVCALTKFTLYIPVKSTGGHDTFMALKERIFDVFGHPLVMISDNGSSFANKLMAASQHMYGYRQIFVMPHTPRANGLAESAVKKLKILLDRHTHDYANWAPFLSTCQAAVNRRITKGINESPFTALFGRPMPTMAALENPELLPTATPEEKAFKELADKICKLQERLRQQSDEVKAAAALADKTQSGRRQVVPGDKIWLTYSDSERARYLRKHGHGKAWRHAFKVTKVKPHAVRLEVPKDGSVPDVLPWQSLRKCAFAAPHFHDDELPVPTVGEHGLPVIDETTGPMQKEAPQAHELADPLGWASPATETYYEIERIVSAARVGRGWRFQVKWVGYPDPTPEPLWKILRDTKNPEILTQIDQCKEDYLASNPSERAMLDREKEEIPRPTATRVQPKRNATEKFTFAVFGILDSTWDVTGTCLALKHLRRTARQRNRALLQLRADAE